MSRGDHIYVHRKFWLYSHHGIDCGDGEVIHFAGEPGAKWSQGKAAATVTRTTMDDFLAGGRLRVRHYGVRNDPDTTVLMAESLLGASQYDLARNNCEHLAQWCCTGEHNSEQVRGVLTIVTQGTATAATFAATGSTVTAAGSVTGVSAAGIMSGLASIGKLVGLGAAAGPALLSMAPTAFSTYIMHHTLRDDEHLTETERASRRVGRTTATISGPAATVAGTGALYLAGTTGLSAAGISSGLATVGGVVGGGMLAGATIMVAGPAVVVAGISTATYLGYRAAKQRRLAEEAVPDEDCEPGNPDHPAKQ